MDDLILSINPDILEIILSQIHQIPCVLNGTLALSLRHISETHLGGEAYYNTENLFKHGSLQGLDPDLLAIISNKLYIPDDRWKDIITNIPDKLRVRGVDMDFVKYSHIDFNLLEYNNYLYTKLYKQTNSFKPVELGPRIVFMPGTIPDNFDDFVKLYKPLTQEFKLLAKFLKHKYELDFEINDNETMDKMMYEEFISYNMKPEDIEREKQEIITFMLQGEEPSGLTMAILEKYREKYTACIAVTPENLRLYTRARFIFNMFIELNKYIVPHLVDSFNLGYNDTVLHAHEYLGLTSKDILLHFHTLYLDSDKYPIFSNLYRFGSIVNRQFPESSIYTDTQQLCFCTYCNTYKYTAQIYEANTGEVYLLVSLRVEYPNFFEYLINKRCNYQLFLDDINYHYQRIESLAFYRNVVEVRSNLTFHSDYTFIVKNYGQFYDTWFSSGYRIPRSMLDADDLMQTIRDGY